MSIENQNNSNRLKLETLSKKMDIDRNSIPTVYNREKSLKSTATEYGNIFKARDMIDYGNEKVDSIRNPKPSLQYSKDVFSSSSKVLSKHVKLNLQVEMSIGEILSLLKTNADGYVSVNIKSMKNFYVALLYKKFKITPEYLGNIFRYDSVQNKKIKFGYTNTEWTLIRRSTLESSAKINFKAVDIKALESRFTDKEKIVNDLNVGGYLFDLKEEFDGDRVAWIKTTLLKDPTKLHKKKIGWGKNIFDIPLIDDHRVDLYEIYTKTTETAVGTGENVSVIFPISIKLENCFENVEIYKILEKTLFDNFNFFTPLHTQVFRLLKSASIVDTTLINNLLSIEDSKTLKAMNKAQSLYLEYKAGLISFCREIKLLYEGFSFKGALSLVKKILGIMNIKTVYVDGKFRTGRDQNQDPLYGIITKEKKFDLIRNFVDSSNYEIVSSKLTLNNGIVRQVELGEEIKFKLVDNSSIKKFLSDLNVMMIKLSELDTGEVYMKNGEEVVNDIILDINEARVLDTEKDVKSLIEKYGQKIHNVYYSLVESISEMGGGSLKDNIMYIANSLKYEKDMYDVLFKILDPNAKILDGVNENLHENAINIALDEITLNPPVDINEVYPNFVKSYLWGLYKDYGDDALKNAKLKFNNNTYIVGDADQSTRLIFDIADLANANGQRALAKMRSSWGQMENKNILITSARTFYLFLLKIYDSLDRHFSEKVELSDAKLKALLNDFKDPKSTFAHLFEKMKQDYQNFSGMPDVFRNASIIDSMILPIASKELKFLIYICETSGIYPKSDGFNKNDFRKEKEIDQNIKASDFKFLQLRDLGNNDDIFNEANDNLMLNENLNLNEIDNKENWEKDRDDDSIVDKISYSTMTNTEKNPTAIFTKKVVGNRNMGASFLDRDITNRTRLTNKDVSYAKFFTNKKNKGKNRSREINDEEINDM